MDLSNLDWNAIGGASQAISTLAVVISIFYLARQLTEMKTASVAQSFFGAATLVQNEEMRMARKRVAMLKDKPFTSWTEEERADAERVCQNYDLFAQFCRYKFVPTKFVVASWGPSIRILWPICRPVVEHIRAERNAPETWDDFEWLYDRAKT